MIETPEQWSATAPKIFPPNETVLAASRSRRAAGRRSSSGPDPTAMKVAGVVGGAAGALAYSVGSTVAANHPRAEARPIGTMADRAGAFEEAAFVVTDTRFLLCSMTRLGGRPKKLLADWPRAEVKVLEHLPAMVTSKVLYVRFVDGSTLAIETSTVQDPELLIAAVGSS